MISDTNRNIKAVTGNDLKPLPAGLFIVGRRWFQRSYGNTYNTFEIKDVYNQKTIHYSEMQYGYGDHYLNLAYDWMKAAGYDVGEYWDFKQKVEYMPIDVSCKRDL
jgi:hypothetical protein